MLIDAFAHLYPPDYLRYLRGLDRPLPVFVRDVPEQTSASFRLGELDRHGIHQQAVALGTPAFDDLFAADQAAASEAARIANDGLAQVVARYPSRFIGVATLPLLTPEDCEPALAELERVLDELPLRGVQLYTTHAGLPLDHAGLQPLWARLEQAGLPILLHPTGGRYNGLTDDYLLWLTFGWPFETTLAMARLVYAGVLERYPQLRLLSHHLGAFVPSMAARIAGVTATLERTSPWRLPQPVLSYFRRFFADTAVNGFLPALAAGREFFGAERVLFGSDYPFVPIEVSLRPVIAWDLPDFEKAQILGGNAEQFFSRPGERVAT
jgi:aminocarboxymuconate-semialdehyde decarboxylase